MNLNALHDNILMEAIPGRKSKFQATLRRHRISQERLADQTEVDPSTVSRWKSGVRNPSLASLQKLKQAGIDIVDVFLSGPSISRKKSLRAKRLSSKISRKAREASWRGRGDEPAKGA